MKASVLPNEVCNPTVLPGTVEEVKKADCLERAVTHVSLKVNAINREIWSWKRVTSALANSGGRACHNSAGRRNDSYSWRYRLLVAMVLLVSWSRDHTTDVTLALLLNCTQTLTLEW